MAANTLWQHRGETLCHCRFKTQARKGKDKRLASSPPQDMATKWKLCPLRVSCPRNTLLISCYFDASEYPHRNTVNQQVCFSLLLKYSHLGQPDFWNTALIRNKKSWEMGDSKQGEKHKTTEERLHHLSYNINSPLQQSAFSTLKVSEDWLATNPTSQENKLFILF